MSPWIRALVGNGRALASAGPADERAAAWSSVADAVAGLGEGRTPEIVLADALGRLRLASGADTAIIWLKVGAEVRAQIVDPLGSGPPARSQLPVESPTCAAVRYGGDQLGAIEISGPAASAEMSQWLREVATAAASLIHTIAVREALRQQVAVATAQQEELRVARADLVARQDTERRRLAADIHDGCQQRATVIAGKIGLIRALLDGHDSDATEQAGRLRDELDGHLDSLVELLGAIIGGEGPPELSAGGLVAALRHEVAGLPLRVEVVGEPGELPEAVERSAYYCCLEAVQNAARHSGGRAAQVSLRREAAGLVFVVTDDGRGFEPGWADSGTGLHSIERRIEAHRGRVDLAVSEQGTRLSGWLPIDGSR